MAKAVLNSAHASLPLCVAAVGLAIALAASGFHAATAQTASPAPRLALSGDTGDTRLIFAEVDNLPAGQAAMVDVSVVAGTSIAKAPLSTAGAGQATIAVGNGHVCVITPETRVKCWGKNDKGQLGNGSTSTTNVQASAATEVKQNATTALTDVLALAAGDSHTCAIMASDRRVKCWGANDKGQLGNGSTTGSNVSVDVTTSATAATALTNVVAIAAGATHTCAYASPASGRRVKCWGSDKAGQIGDGDRNATAIGALKLAGINGKSNSNGRFYRRPKDPMTTRAVDTTFATATPISIGAGGDGTCTVSESGVQCWGRVSYTFPPEPSTRDAEYTNDLILTTNTDPGAATGFVAERVTSLAVSQKHVCARKAGDWLVTCGAFGGKTIDVPLALGLPEGSRLAVVARARPVNALAANGAGSVFCALLDDRVSCWALTGDSDPPTVTTLFDIQMAGARLSDAVAIGLGTTTGADGTEVCVVRKTGAVGCGAVAVSASALASKRAFSDTGVTAIPRARAMVWSRALLGKQATVTVTAGTTSLTGTR